MALRRRDWREDVYWLRWPIGLCLSAATFAIVLWLLAAYYRDEARRSEYNALNRLDLLNLQISEIEEEERIIIENIGVYNSLVAEGVMGEEDRVGLLDEIGEIRSRHNLYPISVDIEGQNRVVLPYIAEVPFPEEQVALLTSRVNLQIPLLHEGDLARFINDLMANRRLLVINRCDLDYSLETDSNYLTFVPHLTSNCALDQFNFRREPYEEPGFGDDF